MSKRRNELYLSDILESIAAIEKYVENISFEKFMTDRKTFSATIRELEIIGEAVSKIDSELKDRYNNVFWDDIKYFRNKIVHEYFGIDAKIVWNVVTQNLPELKENILKIISSENLFI